MCGIIVRFTELNKIFNNLNKIKHRGHTFCVKIINCIAFGHTRLSIQGLNKKYNGPFESDNEIILYNGEIYNFKELNPNFECDIQCLKKNCDYTTFDGDFAIVKYNKDSNILEVVTDRFGKKQLYYKLVDNKIVSICSEIKGIIEKTDIINKKYISSIARFGYVFNNETIVNNIYKFEPGIKYLIDSNGNIIAKKNIEWNSNKLIPKNVNKNNLLKLLELSIKRRFISDIPICLIYSGGLDSSIVLYLLNKNKIKTKIFTIENSEDLKYAEKYAKKLKISINKIKINYKDYINAHYANECATDLGSVIPKFNLMKAIKKRGYNVVVGGSGADEIFGGYKRMKEYDYQHNDIFNELIYYHLPRIDKVSMFHTIEYRTPYTADYIIDFGLKLSYNKRINKKYLKSIFKNKIPNYILNRQKVPLKSNKILYNKDIEKIKLLKIFEKKIFKMLQKQKNDFE